MPISSPIISKVNDYLAQAIAFAQLALDEARAERDARHMLAHSEHRVNGLIDVVRWETRIQEALLTLKGIRETPGLGVAVRGSISASDRGGDDPVDGESGGGNELAGSRLGGGTVADDSSTDQGYRRLGPNEPWPVGTIITQSGAFVSTDPAGVHRTDRSTPPAVAP